MKKKFLALILASTIGLSIMACGGSSGRPAESSNKEAPKQAAKEVTYQSILDEYTQKITEATPLLVEEYNTESAEKSGDINALAELSNAKITKLADISNAGIEEMAKLMTKNGDEYETYEEWAGKLTDVYMQQSQQITAAYMNSATQ